MEKNKKIRWNYIVYPKFQIALIISNLVVITGLTAIIGFQSYRSFEYMRELGRNVNLDANHPFFQFVDVQANQLYGNLFISIFVGFVFSTLFTLIFSHKLAGPLVRLKSYFSQISETGKVEPLKFRKNDYFSDFPPVVNSALEEVSKSTSKAA